MPAVAFLLRKTGLTLTEIRELDGEVFGTLHAEVVYQEAVEEYTRAHYVANIMATVANTVARKNPKTYRASDFLPGSPPKRVTDAEELTSLEALKKLAERFGIRLPSRAIVDL